MLSLNSVSVFISFQLDYFWCSWNAVSYNDTSAGIHPPLKDLIEAMTWSESKQYRKQTVVIFSSKGAEFIVCWIIIADWVISLKSALLVIGWQLPGGSIRNLFILLLQTERKSSLKLFDKLLRQTIGRWINETKATDQLTYWIFDTFEAEQVKNTMQTDAIFTALMCETLFIYLQILYEITPVTKRAFTAH